MNNFEQKINELRKKRDEKLKAINAEIEKSKKEWIEKAQTTLFEEIKNYFLKGGEYICYLLKEHSMKDYHLQRYVYECGDPNLVVKTYLNMEEFEQCLKSQLHPLIVRNSKVVIQKNCREITVDCIEVML